MKQAQLHIGDERTTITFEGEGGNAQTVVLGFGSLGLCSRYFRHFPPTPAELETAIAVVEDELMPAIPRLPRHARLLTTDAESVALVRSSGMTMEGAVDLGLEDVERLFNRLANVAYGRPASREGIPERGTFAANLLIVRELMHHVGYGSIAVVPPA